MLHWFVYTWWCFSPLCIMARFSEGGRRESWEW